jgi:uncharacterized membrane protein YheB (UPF0754 family)
MEWILIPLLAALIGWFTNYLAVKMIFRPYEPINVLGIKVQGLIPKKRKELAEKVGEVVSDSLFTEEELQKILSSINYNEILARKIDELISKNLVPIISKIFPFISSLPEETTTKIKNEILKYIEKNVSFTLDRQILEQVDSSTIKDLVHQKIEGFSVETLEEIILRISRRELKAIEILGGVLGFIIGLLQVLIIHLK